MSENIEMNPKQTEKVSLFAELNGTSIGIGIALIIVIIASITLYVFMNLSPAKTVDVIDDADIFSETEYEDIFEEAQTLSKSKDINVVIVTTRNKGGHYSNSDADEVRFAENFYSEHIKGVPLQNNSGICILVDLTLDQPGQRFFWIYTYGTAHFAVSDSECNNLFNGYYSELGNEEYGQAILGITKDLQRFHYNSYSAIVIFTILAPIGLACLVTFTRSPKRRLDRVPAMATYAPVPIKLEENDSFVKREVVHMESSGSGGGYSGGGGGGGGGGGFSGGGGGRF